VLIKSNRTALQTYKVEERTFGTPCINTPKHLLEVTYETILLSMDIALGKSLDLLLKFYVVDPMNINLSQSQSFLDRN